MVAARMMVTARSIAGESASAPPPGRLCMGSRNKLEDFVWHGGDAHGCDHAQQRLRIFQIACVPRQAPHSKQIQSTEIL